MTDTARRLEQSSRRLLDLLSSFSDARHGSYLSAAFEQWSPPRLEHRSFDTFQLPLATQAHIAAIYQEAVDVLTQTAVQHFDTTLARIGRFEIVGEIFATYEYSLRQCYTREYIKRVDSVWQAINREVRAALSRLATREALSASIPSVPPLSRGTFSEEVTAILQQAFSHQSTLTRAERRVLSDATGLSERQIATWFANQRQRRGQTVGKTPPQVAPAQTLSTSSFRPAPYKVALRPRLKLRDFSHSSNTSLESDASEVSDASTAPSSIHSWIASSAAPHVEFSSPSTAPSPLFSPVDERPLALAFNGTQPATTQVVAQQPISERGYSLLAEQHLLPTPAVRAQDRQRVAPTDILEHSTIYHPSHDRAQEPVLQPVAEPIFEQPAVANAHGHYETDFVPLLPNFDFEAQSEEDLFMAEFMKGGLGELFGAVAGQVAGHGGSVSANAWQQGGFEAQAQSVSVILPADESQTPGGFWLGGVRLE